jgi:hypothetical protein
MTKPMTSVSMSTAAPTSWGRRAVQLRAMDTFLPSDDAATRWRGGDESQGRGYWTVSVPTIPAAA